MCYSCLTSVYWVAYKLSRIKYCTYISHYDAQRIHCLGGPTWVELSRSRTRTLVLSGPSQLRWQRTGRTCSPERLRKSIPWQLGTSHIPFFRVQRRRPGQRDPFWTASGEIEAWLGPASCRLPCPPRRGGVSGWSQTAWWAALPLWHMTCTEHITYTNKNDNKHTFNTPRSTNLWLNHFLKKSVGKTQISTYVFLSWDSAPVCMSQYNNAARNYILTTKGNHPPTHTHT